MRVAELEGLQFQISASSDNASKHLNTLAESLKSLKEAVSGIGLTKLKNVAGAVKEVADASSRGDGDKLAKLSDALVNLGSSKISSTIGKNLSSIVDAVNSTDEASVGRLERMAAALSDIGSVGRIKIPKLNLPEQQMQTRGDLENIQTPSASITEQSMMSVGNAMDDISTRSAPTFRAVIKGIISDLKGLATGSDFASRGLRGIMRYTIGLPITLGSGFAKRIGEATSSLGHMFSAIKRIALYRLIRSVIREVTQGLQEGIKNIYAYSNALNGEFASAMDSLASSSLYLKNSLGAMAAPIIQSLIPAINWAIDRIVTLMNVINMFVAALGGKATTTVAKRVQTVFNAAGAAAGGAGGAAKKALKDLKTYTIDIDELNIIDPKEKSGSGGGGGGGGGGLDPSTMFEEVDIDKTVSNFAKALRTAFEKHNWSGLGILLGAKFNEAVGTIDFEGLGTKVGGGIGAIITTAYYATKTANFKRLGEGFATFFNNAIKEINFRELGGLLVMWGFTKPLDFLISFIRTTDFTEVGKAISDFLLGAYTELTEWLKAQDWREIGSMIANKIGDLLAAIDWGALFITMTEFAYEAFMAKGNFLLGLLFPNRQDADWKKAGKNIFSQVKDGFDKEAQGNDKPNFFVQVFDDSNTWWQTVKSLWNGKVGFVKEFKTNLKNDSPTWWSNLKRWWNEKISSPVASFKTDVKNDSATWWANIQKWWNAVAGTLSVTVSLVNNVSNLWSEVQKWWNQKAGTLTTKLNIVVPRVTVNWIETVGSYLKGGSFKVPSISVSWNARGAILDGAQIFGMLGNKFLGAGEAGKEALLPLEQNTGWMDTIAEKVRDTMATAANYEYSGMDKILSRLDAIEAMLGNVEDNTRIQAEKPSNTYVSIGGKTVRDAVIRQQRADGYSFA